MYSAEHLSSLLKISGNARRFMTYAFGILAALFLSYAAGLDLSITTALVLLVVYFKCVYRSARVQPYILLHLSFLFIILFGASHLIISRSWSVFFIPFSAVVMLVTILFNDLVIAFLLTVACSLTVAGLAGNNFSLGILLFASGILSALLVYGARRRITILRAGFIIGVTQVLLLFFIRGYRVMDPESYLVVLCNGIICAIIVLGVLPIFEFLFKTITNISLLELADFNHPVLNRMMLEAPGTYHHSLIVGNLSEAACQAVRANALLARIGAYYHDIGKLQKPEYFSENQGLTGNKHDALSPSISKLVIMNHVKDGIELARKYRLNGRLIDFIQLHHGNSLVYYFYRRALENVDEDQEIKEDVFRYPGPKPNTKETAIVMLADSVEAATRALKEPTVAKIEELVHKIVNNKFIDGQLDECDLTLKDLERISSVFIRILSGIYHSRVNYPDEKNESNNKKPPKEAPNQPHDDKKNSP